MDREQKYRFNACVFLTKDELEKLSELAGPNQSTAEYATSLILDKINEPPNKKLQTDVTKFKPCGFFCNPDRSEGCFFCGRKHTTEL